MKNLLLQKLVLIIAGMFLTSFQLLLARDTYPNGISSFTGANTYCVGQTASNLSMNITTTNCNNGANNNMSTTVRWYYNTLNSTLVATATLVATQNATAGTTNYTYLPSTAVSGNYYYFAVITSTAGACAPATSTSTGTQLVTVSTPSTITSTVGGGNWTAGTTWIGGVAPSCGDNAIIQGPVTVNAASPIGNLTINTSGTLTATNAITVTGTFTIQSGGTYNHNNASAAATTVFAGTEVFNANSNINVNSWSSTAVPFATSVSGNLGNVTLNIAGVWNQNGEFSNHTVQGNLTITAGSINFDPNGVTTALTVGGLLTLSSTGTHSIFNGANVPATYTMNFGGITQTTASNFYMFTGAGAAGQTCLITINSGSWNIAGDFFVATGCLNTPTCSSFVTYDVDVNITGNFIFNGATATDRFDIVYLSLGDSDVDFSATGDITVTSAPVWFHFNDIGACTGDLTISCNNMSINHGVDNDFAKGSGNVSITCAGTFTHNGAATVTRFLEGTSADGTLTFSANAVNFLNSSSFYGINGGDGNSSFTIANGFNMVSGICHLVHNGDGNSALSIGGLLNMDAGDLRGIYEDLGSSTNGLIDFDINSIDYDGGLFIGSYGRSNSAGANTFTVTNDVNLNFTGAGTSESVRFGVGQNNGTASSLDLDIGGDLIISGNVGGIMISHLGNGVEDIDIIGNVTISGGENTINGYLGAALTCDHNVTLDIGGNLTVSGGTTSFSKESGTLNAGTGNMIDGNVTISGGILDLKNDDGSGTVLIGGNFSQSGGTFDFHNEAANSTADVVAVTVAGTFSHTGGTLNFDNNNASTATHTLTLNGPSIVVGGSGLMTRANSATSTVFGEVYVNPSSGTTTYNRSSNNHQIQGARIILNAGKVMNASGSAQNMQISANDLADDVIPATSIMLDVLGTLNLGNTQVFGRSSNATHRPTSMVVQSGGEIQLTRTQGFYDGSANASIMDRTFNSTNTSNTVNSMNWYLNANSRVTYNGTGNQVVTGKFPDNFTTTPNSDVTLATNPGYHYGILEIDHQGTIGTNYVYPIASNVFVRTQLDMDRGEFRLDGSGTGYMINVENSATTGIIMTGANGDAYIRSETNLGTNPSIVRWYIGTTTGAHVVPFGHSAGANNYVPFTFNVNSGGGAGSFVDMSTRSTDDGALANNKDNLPWETTVTNMYSPALSQDGATESVIDRWWQIDVSTAYDADITFTYRGVENTLDAPYNLGDIGAQRWDGANWQPDNANWGATPSVTAGTGTVTVPGVVAFSPWVLSSVSAPLPAKIINFEGQKREKYNLVEWVVASEENVSHYVVQSSLDGINFQDIGTVTSKGNTSQDTYYDFSDYNYYNPRTFYRLLTKDYDELFEYSKVIVLDRIEDNNGLTVDLFPNPSYGIVELKTNTIGDGETKVRVLSNVGQLIYNEIYYSVKGTNSHKFDLSNLSNGVYYLEVESFSERKTIKFIKQ